MSPQAKQGVRVGWKSPPFGLFYLTAYTGFAQLPEDQALEILNVTRGGTPTPAAVMNFCVYPQSYLPQLAITALVVPGTEIGEHDGMDSRFLDKKRIEGTIKTMADEAITFCKRSMKV